MKTKLFAVLLALSGVCSFAQTRDSVKTKSKATVVFNPNSRRNGFETYPDAGVMTGVGANPGSVINTIDHRYEGLRGTPYFLPEWTKGTIEMVAGQTYTDVPVKFDAYRQHLLLLRPWAGNDSIVVNTEQVKSFQLRTPDGQSYRFSHVPAAKPGDSQNDSYFMVLCQGKTTLLKRVAKVFKQADYKDPYSTGVRYDAFRDSFSYYLLKPDQTLTKVKLSKNALLAALNDQEAALSSFIKQENLALNTEEDAIRLLKHYNSL